MEGGWGPEAVLWYADNKLHSADVSFGVPGSEWDKFEASDLYRDLVAYVASLKNQDER